MKPVRSSFCNVFFFVDEREELLWHQFPVLDSGKWLKFIKMRASSGEQYIEDLT